MWLEVNYLLESGNGDDCRNVSGLSPVMGYTIIKAGCFVLVCSDCGAKWGGVRVFDKARNRTISSDNPQECFPFFFSREKRESGPVMFFKFCHQSRQIGQVSFEFAIICAHYSSRLAASSTALSSVFQKSFLSYYKNIDLDLSLGSPTGNRIYLQKPHQNHNPTYSPYHQGHIKSRVEILIMIFSFLTSRCKKTKCKKKILFKENERQRGERGRRRVRQKELPRGPVGLSKISDLTLSSKTSYSVLCNSQVHSKDKWEAKLFGEH